MHYTYGHAYFNCQESIKSEYYQNISKHQRDKS
jgi:hypothetical protein